MRSCERKRKKMEKRGTHRRMFLENYFPVVEEILLEGVVLRVIGLQHGTEEAGNFFGLGRQVDGFT